MPPLNTYQLDHRYREFWDRFKIHCKRNALSLHPTTEFPFKAENKNDHQISVSLTMPIYFQRWRKFGGKVDSDLIDIILYGDETVDTDTNEVILSGITVEYYDVPISKKAGNKVEAKAWERIRYDFKAPARFAHPVFHAQISSTPCVPGFLQKNSAIQWTVGAKGNQPRLSNIKIPTAYMNVISIIANICADHSPPPVFEKLRQSLLKNRHKVPVARTEELREHPLSKPKQCWEGLAWYVDEAPQMAATATAISA